MSAAPDPSENKDSARGLAFAVSAYVLWGFLPLYMKAMAHLPTAEVIAHRIIWSVPVAGAILIAIRRTEALRQAIRTPRMIGMGMVTAALISVNWGIYVWAIQSGHALDAALGYFINPLFSILVGAVILREKLDRTQMAAVALAALAVAVLTWEAGRLPLVALGLTVTWGAYAYCKKMLPIGPNQGFMLEVLILLPAALGWVTWLWLTGGNHFAVGVPSDTLLLLGCGLITACPLMIYANGAKLLRLSTIGILQYIAPTMIFLTAVFLFDEPMGLGRMIAFPMIWAALILYSAALIRQSRKPQSDF
jgi:chloramphenicol-sensitive protein RarD